MIAFRAVLIAHEIVPTNIGVGLQALPTFY